MYEVTHKIFCTRDQSQSLWSLCTDVHVYMYIWILVKYTECVYASRGLGPKAIEWNTFNLILGVTSCMSKLGLLSLAMGSLNAKIQKDAVKPLI